MSEGIPRPILETAARLKGLPRNLGTHPGGVVITPRPITSYSSVHLSRGGLPLLAWEKDAAEDVGLVKIDLLGNRSLAVLRDSLAMIRDNHGVDIPWEEFDPSADPAVEQFVRTGDTVGIFYIESPATRLLLQKMGRADFAHLVAASSIIRPAANAWITEYVSRLRGKPWGMWPQLDRVLADTYGIMVYQEDVSRVAVAIAGFTAAEADTLRKVLSRKDRSRRLADYRQRFFAGCSRNGVPAAVVAELWDMILSFDGYSFCKAHSASYALVSCKLAWVKLHYPLEFFTAVLNNGGGFYAWQTYLHAAQRRGLRVRWPDVNRSQASFTCDGGRLRFGLGWLQHIPERVVQRLLEERQRRGLFYDFADFIQRLNPTMVELRQLVRSGACDSLASGYTRPQLFWQFLRMRSTVGQAELLAPEPPPPHIKDYSPEVKLSDEIAVLGICLSRHPVTALRQSIGGSSRLTASCDLATHPHGATARILGILVTAKEVLTRHHQPMGFATFEDEYGLVEVVLFPGLYRSGRLVWGSACLVTGRVLHEFGACSLQAEQIEWISS